MSDSHWKSNTDLYCTGDGFGTTLRFPCISAWINFTSSTSSSFSLVYSRICSWFFVNESCRLILTLIDFSFSFGRQWFFLFFLCFLNTFSLKLLEVNFTILHCRPFLSVLPMGWVLSIFFIIMFLLILLSLARVSAKPCLNHFHHYQVCSFHWLPSMAAWNTVTGNQFSLPAKN